MSELIDFLNERFQRDDLKQYEAKFELALNESNLECWMYYKDIKIKFLNRISEEVPINSTYDYWNQEFKKYLLTNINYQENKDIFSYEDIVEIPLMCLDVSINPRVFPINLENLFNFENSIECINFGQISEQAVLRYLDSSAYGHYIKTIVFDLIDYLDKDIIHIYYFSNFLLRNTFFTAKYINKDNKNQELEYIINKVKSCCYILSLNEDCHLKCELKPHKEKNFIDNERKSWTKKEYSLPICSYNENLVSFYKSFKISSLPSQKFLDLYHIFEYLFLRVSEENLYDKVKGFINHPYFSNDTKSIDRIISIIKKSDNENDETEMLKKVIFKYTDEDEIIDFLKSDSLIQNIKGKKIFGEEFNISLKQGHAISNVAKVLKHVRNALVHSSDKYAREDCYIPFTESEQIVKIFIPILEFLAEKVIAGTAEPING